MTTAWLMTDDRKPSTRYSIEWNGAQWCSKFPAEFAAWNREHDTIPQAYDYMRNDAKVTAYIYIKGKDETHDD
jgi:hypothetical protein